MHYSEGFNLCHFQKKIFLWYTVNLFIFDNVICVTLKVPSIRIFLSIGSLNGKSPLSEGHPRFLSIFPFVNIQIKSIVYSLCPIQLCIQ